MMIGLSKRERGLVLFNIISLLIGVLLSAIGFAVLAEWIVREMVVRYC
ncbi:hypothetical protein LCGC14_0892510 [marine sediment metagenome]|uniref:Uncharacterized protein n=1 Tax=marine sediment metagenome TaxID=412755 RepID=A0A0F9S5T0_9ZZZZ